MKTKAQLKTRLKELLKSNLQIIKEVEALIFEQVRINNVDGVLGLKKPVECLILNDTPSRVDITEIHTDGTFTDNEGNVYEVTEISRADLMDVLETILS